MNNRRRRIKGQPPRFTWESRR